MSYNVNEPGKIINTFLNPLGGGNTWTPKWFTPLGDSNPGANATLFHAAAILATYGGLGYGSRIVQEMYRDKGAENKIKRAIKSNVDSSDSLFNPDPDVMDEEDLDTSKNPFLQKNAGWFGAPTTAPGLVKASSMFLPALAAYTAYMYGNKKADESYDEDARVRNERTIKKLENLYQKANYERLLSSKGLTPKEVGDQSAQLMNLGKEKPAADKAKKKPAGSLGTALEKQAGWPTTDNIREYLNIPTDSDSSAFDPLWALAVLGLGGIGYGSYKVSKNYLEDQDPEMRRAKMIKKELERHFENKKPTEIIPDLDPRVSAILNRTTDKKEKPKGPVTPTLDSVPPSDSMVDLLNT